MTRFEMKWLFELSADEVSGVLEKEKLGEHDKQRLCYKCYQKLMNQADSIFFASMLGDLMKEMVKANMPKEQMMKCGLVFFEGYVRARGE
jgi:hypothetical protein